MPNVLLETELAVVDHPEVRHFLRGRDNPFDVFVAARKPEANFKSYHVATVCREVYHALRDVVKRYQPECLQKESDIPKSGVLVILGNRGTGKTHMVHALQQNWGFDKACVVVVPALYEPHRSFVEYLLHQLVRHFQDETAGEASCTLTALADALARQVLVQAFYGMNEVEWLARHITGRWTFWQYMTGIGTRELADQKRLLIGDLAQPDNGTVLDVCRSHEQDPAGLRTMALEHIDRMEANPHLAGRIRHGLYSALVLLAFGDPIDSVYDFLLDGYTQVEARHQPAREILVEELFRALTELCLLAGMPVVFAFDALETLLGDPPDEKICHPFFRGMADALDSLRGIPFLLFAEQGHWERLEKFRSPYVQQRFQQGVIRVPQHGTLSVLRLPPISAEQLGELVAVRMKPLLMDYYEAEQFDVPAIFPFTEQDLHKIARNEVGQEPPLRQALQALGDRYNEMAYGKATEMPVIIQPAPEKSFIEPMEDCWERTLRAAKRRMDDGGLSGVADQIHSGILMWLECLIAEGTATESGKPVQATNVAPQGTHPTYGQLTCCDWQNHASRTIGLGLLLGTGKGMPRDLETKLLMTKMKERPFDVLVLLWPREPGYQQMLHEQFPPSTREVWDKYVKTKTSDTVDLRTVTTEELVNWLAMPGWMKAVRDENDGVPDDLIHHFVAEKTAALLKLVAPGE